MKREQRLAEVLYRIADVKAEIELIRFTLIIYTYVYLICKPLHWIVPMAA